MKEPTQVKEANNKDSGKTTQETKFKCPPCQKIFKSKHSLAMHVNFSQGKGSGSCADLKCQLCDTIEGSCTNMIQHVQDDHKLTNSKLSNLKVHARKDGAGVISTEYCNSLCKYVKLLTC